MEALQNREVKRRGSALVPHQFGSPTGPDPHEVGRKGGIASGQSRRLRPLRELEAGIIQSRNGAAKAKLLETKRRDQAELLERQLKADRMVAELDLLALRLREETAKERERLDELLVKGDELRLEVAALEQRKQQASIDDTTLIELLRDVGEQRVQAACEACGWLDGEDVDELA